MTTFNITRSNDQANSNLLLIGIALVAIVAVVIAFAPALFSSSTVAVEAAPFGNGSNDGNFTTTTGDGRLEGTTPNLSIYPLGNDDGDPDGFAIITPGFTLSVNDCDSFERPSPLDAAGNYVYPNTGGGIVVAYSQSANAVIVREKDVEFYLDLDTCEWGKFLLPS